MGSTLKGSLKRTLYGLLCGNYWDCADYFVMPSRVGNQGKGSERIIMLYCYVARYVLGG